MTKILMEKTERPVLLMGNEAIARGALEAGVNVITGYPGTPSSEIVTSLGKAVKDRNLYVEWSINEKVALEAAASASFSGLRAMCVMKQVGVNVASDFLLHLAEYGTRGGMILVSCEDPGALSSTNEGDSRPYAKMMEFPLLEPGDFQEAKDLTKWAFELSERIRNIVMVRSVTRLSHASGGVLMGDLPRLKSEARFRFNGSLMDPMEGPVLTFPSLVEAQRRRQLAKLAKASELFDTSPFNTYTGPQQPEILIITSSACNLYSMEAVDMLGLSDRIGILKLATTWPLPPKMVEKHIAAAKQVMVVEEGTPFLEDNIKVFVAESADKLGIKPFHGKKNVTLPPVNELNPDLVADGIRKVLGLGSTKTDAVYREKALRMAADLAPPRELTFCPGCPHRASFWLIDQALKLDNRCGFVCGDIGCYTLAAIGCGFNALKTSHAMGSGLGLASGFGKLGHFGMTQSVVAVCGDSTFFHAAMPALANAVHNQADLLHIVLDNSGTAMTGFQPHPGIARSADGGDLPALDIPKICEAMGATVAICDPFEFDRTRQVLLDLLEQKGVKVLVLRQACALSPAKKGLKPYEMTVDQDRCLSDNCGCNRLCTRVFKCPGLTWDPEEKQTRIDDVICTGCGVCAAVCPQNAIIKREAHKA